MPVNSCVRALVDTMRAVGPVGKNDYNENQRFNFRGIDAVLNGVGPQLREHGVIPIPEVLEYTHTLRDGRNGKLNHYIVKVAYHFFVPLDPPDKSFMAGNAVQTVVVYGEAMDAGDKGMSKAMSVAYRTALIQMFAIPTGEPDPDSQTHELAEHQESEKIPRTVPELRVMISRHLQGKEGWTLDQIAENFQKMTEVNIREATAEQLQWYYEQVCQ